MGPPKFCRTNFLTMLQCLVMEKKVAATRYYAALTRNNIIICCGVRKLNYIMCSLINKEDL